MSSPAATVGNAPKTMSSRLLTMKFMQRAAAASTASNTLPDEPPAKRQRKGEVSAEVNVNSLVDQKAIQAAIAEEETKKQMALDKQAAELGDTRWVLSFADQKDSPTSHSNLRVVQTGFSNLDQSSVARLKVVEEENAWDRPVKVGRRSFGKFNRVLERQQRHLDENSDWDSDSEEEDEDEDEDENGDDTTDYRGENDLNDPMDNLIMTEQQKAEKKARIERKTKRDSEKAARLKKMVEKRKKKDVNLNKAKTTSLLDGLPNHLTSLSGRATSNAKSGSDEDKTCFKCGQRGHIAYNCHSPRIANNRR
ncbi:hypothetical protein B7463_g9658, partial [Scytalidium lignicola]